MIRRKSVPFILLLLPAAAYAQFSSLTRMVDTATAQPGTADVFTGFGAPATDGAQVAFFGMSASQSGLYVASNSGYRRIADRTTLFPNDTVNFAFFSAPSIDHGEVAFFGRGAAFRQGVFMHDGKEIRTIADRTTPIPNAAGTFTGFSEPSSSEDTIVFRGQGPESDGVYARHADLMRVVADTAALAPGGSTFESFSTPHISGDTVASRAVVSGVEGIYTRTLDDPISLIARVGDPLPNALGAIEFIDTPVVDHHDDPHPTVVFTAVAASAIALLAVHDGVMTSIADTITPIPEGVGAFTGFSSAASAGHDMIVFVGFGSNAQVGLYSSQDGKLTRLLSAGQTLEDLVVADVFIGRQALHDSQLAFGATFTNGFTAIYRAGMAVWCPCDWNRSSTLDSQDFFDFLTSFFADNADFNDDAQTNSQDFFDFLACFFTGCT